MKKGNEVVCSTNQQESRAFIQQINASTMKSDKKRILLITQYFYPENFKSNDIAFELVEKGYDVHVLTGIPNYPVGKFYKGYGLFSRRIEKIKGVSVFRSFQFPRGKGGGLRLVLNYFSYAFFATVWALWLSFKYKYDFMFVHEPSPITQGIPAVIVKKIRKIPVFFWVLDLWPESLESAGGVRNKQIIKFFLNITKWVYRNSDKILISSRGFEKSILEKGDFKSKLIYFPNWGEDVFVNQNNETIPIDLPNGFKVMFAGNIGEAQDIDSILKAALVLRKEKEIKFLIVGDGRKKEWGENFIRENSLEETVFFLGRYPLNMMPAFFKKADVMLVTLKDELIFNLTVPAKLQAYMLSQKIVLGMLNGEGADIINEAKCGYTVNAGDYNALADKIKEIKLLNQTQKIEFEENAGKYYHKYFCKKKCIDNLIKILEHN